MGPLDKQAVLGTCPHTETESLLTLLAEGGSRDTAKTGRMLLLAVALDMAVVLSWEKNRGCNQLRPRAQQPAPGTTEK